jgi:hypothetical protein
VHGVVKVMREIVLNVCITECASHGAFIGLDL